MWGCPHCSWSGVLGGGSFCTDSLTGYGFRLFLCVGGLSNEAPSPTTTRACTVQAPPHGVLGCPYNGSMAHVDQWNNRVGRELARRLKEQWAEEQAPCWLCGQPIDYTAAPQTPNACEPDHIVPRSEHPELALEVDNIRPAHCSCNRARGDKAPPLGLGTPSRNWFV